jgi:S1-C subfamily serine protease
MPGRRAIAVALAAALSLASLSSVSAQAQQRGPASVADVAEKVLDAVVNISTSQSVGGSSPPHGPFHRRKGRRVRRSTISSRNFSSGAGRRTATGHAAFPRSDRALSSIRQAL